MLHVHWHKAVKHPFGRRHYGLYAECRCGHRKAYPSGTWQPLDYGWVKTGEWTTSPGLPPRPSGGSQ